jgi:superfamily I DNA/RNA helicase
MTRHQAKGREMDAIVLVQHPDEFETMSGQANDRRVLYTCLTRAGHNVTFVLPPDPLPTFEVFTRLARNPTDQRHRP